MKFILKPNNRNATDEELLDDLKKVSSELNKESFTQSEYDKIGRYSSGTIKKRLGWNNALEKAGLEPSTQKNVPDEKILEDLKKVAEQIAPLKLTSIKYNELGKYSRGIIERRFGWNNALQKLGLEISNLQNISNKELFENMEQVWIKFGGQPSISKFSKPLSKYSSHTYTTRFGSWPKALEAFVEYINSENSITQESEESKTTSETVQEIEPIFKHKTKRNPSERLKVLVLMRDGNKCRLCGRILVGDEIHFDHIKPWSKGGETVLENLQVLCAKHNLAKGNMNYPDNKD